MLVYDSQSDTGYQINALDRKLIQLTQSGLPLVSQPYQELAQQLGITACEVKARFQRMLDHGVIRRIAAVPNHYSLGFRANGMTVWNVPDNRISDLGPKIGAFEFVSHCYHRPRHLPDWPYNLFAMVHGHSRDDVQDHIQAISDVIGNDNHGSDVLYSTRILKKTGLRLAD